MNRKYIYSYKQGSKSAKSLARSLGIKRIKHTRSRFRATQNKTIINWGCSELPSYITGNGLLGSILNAPSVVRLASNKLSCFTYLEECGVKVPFFTTEQEVAQQACDDGTTVVVRHLLQGHSGRGIELCEEGDHVPSAPLYTAYIKKKDEYRVHVFRGEVLSVQRKARREDCPDDEVNWKIRNHSNGFIFARNEDRDIPQEVSDEGLKAVEALGLDFGAVDVLWNTRKGAFVLEVNTAPGLEGETLDEYTRAFQRL